MYRLNLQIEQVGSRQGVFKSSDLKLFDVYKYLNGIKVNLRSPNDTYILEKDVTPYEATQSSDLASYISDDYGLIAEALIIDYKDEWVNALAKEYVEERIPYNSLKPLNGELCKIILKS